MKYVFRIFAILVFLGLSIGFFWWNSMHSARVAHVDIRNNMVAHPEFIPSANAVRIGASGFDAIVGDFYWLSAIQYIGSNAISAEYKKYLGIMLGLITDIVPHFTYPYEIGLLLMPDYNNRYENLSEEKQKEYVDAAIALGEKGLRNECDARKLDAIRQEETLSKVWSDETMKNPCSNPMIPYYLGYIAFWNQNNPAKASEYYKIAAANENAVRGARVMAAIMQGKSGNRQKSIIMFLSLAESTGGEKSTECRIFANELSSLLLQAYAANAAPTGSLLKKVEATRANIVQKLQEGSVSIDKNPVDFDDFCSTPLNKAVRELNLDYLARADAAYFQKTGSHAVSAKELFDKRAIDYLPADFQKSDDDQYIVYYYNRKLGNWDFTLGNYNSPIYGGE